MSATRARLLILLAAFLFSTSGAAIKACSLTSWQIACFRSGIAALLVALVAPGSRRIWRPRVLLVGVTYAATVVFFVLANKLTTSAQTIFLQATNPLFVLVLAPWLLRERLRRADLLMVIVVAAGAALLLFGQQRAGITAPDPVHGNALALLSGICWAVTIIGFRWFAKHGREGDSPASVLVAGNVIAFLACLPMSLPVANATPVDVSVIVYLGVFQLGLANLLLARSIHRVPAVEAATLLLLEPVFNPIWTWLLHGEKLTLATLLGGALILCATLGTTLLHSRHTSGGAARPQTSSTPQA